MAVVHDADQPSRNLVDNVPEPAPYLFVEHVLPPGESVPERRGHGTCRTFVVVTGRVRLEFVDPAGDPCVRHYDAHEGWHAPEGSVYRVVNDGTDKVLLLEAGDPDGPGRIPAGNGAAAMAPCQDVSRYAVIKPFGHEVWYTANLPGSRYVVRKICMTAGHRSALRSYAHMTETSLLLDGQMTVVNGVPAPANRAVAIDVDRLVRTAHRPRTRWSSPPNTVHGVIVDSDCTWIAVSTPEVDDVVTWDGSARI